MGVPLPGVNNTLFWTFFFYFFLFLHPIPDSTLHSGTYLKVGIPPPPHHREFVLFIQSRFLVLAEKVKNVSLAAWPGDTFFPTVSRVAIFLLPSQLFSASQGWTIIL